MGIQNLMLYQRCYDAVLYALPLLNKAPKAYRPSLVREIQVILVRMLSGIVVANQTHDRHDILQTINLDLEMVRALLRLSHELKLMPTKSYGHLSAQLEEVGRLLGGWLRRSKPGPGGPQPRPFAAAIGTTEPTQASFR